VASFKNRLPTTVLVLSLLSISFSTKTSAADIAAGKEIYNSSCVACHGTAADGNNAVGAPALAGQHRSYLDRQLANYSRGVRGADKSDRFGQQMLAIAALVNTPISRANVSAYLASLDKPVTSVTSQKTDDGNNAGYKIYQASCGACHGADASGNQSFNSPSLVGLSSAYLLRQYGHFLDGTRGANSSDRLGRQMSMMAKAVSNDDKIDAVIAYIVSLQD
jgi:cytochrome c oxidase subunit 2